MSESLPPLAVKTRKRPSAIWLVPIGAGLVAAYLIATTLADRGPLITVSFKTAISIVPQQTFLQHKAVTLGTVEDVSLSPDLLRAVVKIRLNKEGARVVNDQARFWVVRPRVATGSISGLETLVSGAYIEVDPANGVAPAVTHDFMGLEDPPSLRSDEPGTEYVLHASRLGSLGPGAPVFYRDINVGQVLGYDLGDGMGPITLNVFVRKPYDRFVRQHTHFWNASGLSLNIGAQGVHVEIASLQALLLGGIAFDTAQLPQGEFPSAEGSNFALFDSKDAADQAGYQRLVPCVAYFQSSVGGLAAGSPVEIFGIVVGTVTEVRLLLDPKTGQSRARVAFALQPERVFDDTVLNTAQNSDATLAAMVQNGMRAVLESSNFITGQKAVSLHYVRDATPAGILHEGSAIVLPSQAGGLDTIATSLSDIAAKLATIPFDRIGNDLAGVLHTFNGPDTGNALHALADTLHNVSTETRSLGPAVARLPAIAQNLELASKHAADALSENGYGPGSDMQRSLERLLDQSNDAARSLRLLADYLERHPEALVRGRVNKGGEK
jgi:paraquat-inducible protein B